MWIRGKLDPIWDTSYKNFPYKKYPLNLEGIDDDLGGTLYDMRNPLPDWVYKLKVDLNSRAYAFYRMVQGQEIPTHIDHFSKYCEIYKKNRKDVKRTIIFLEDYVDGHYFKIGSHVIQNYKAGEYVTWSCDVPHSVRNDSSKDRYTLQITGV